MKVLMLNGSPRKDGNTSIALEEMKKIFEAEGVETEIVRVGNKDVRGCIACGRCYELGKCVFDDVVNELAPKFEAADGLVIASPVYYASANATLIAVLDRLFYSSHFDKTMKVGASVVCARRGGCSATFDELNKYFTIDCFQPVLEFNPWTGTGRGRDGRRRKTDHACTCKKYGISDEEYRLRKREVWLAGNRRKSSNTLYPIEKKIIKMTGV